jgi:hypothetical protein
VRYLLTTEQAEILQVIEQYRGTLKVKATLNKSLGLPIAELDDALNLNRLYGLFFSTLEQRS